MVTPNRVKQTAAALSLALAGVVLMLFAALPATADEQTEHYFVLFNEETGIDLSIFDEYNIRTDGAERFEVIDGVLLPMKDTEQAKLLRDPRIDAVEPDKPVEVSSQWVNSGYERVRAGIPYSQGFTGDGVKVAVLDTGLSDVHPDISADACRNFVGVATDCNDENGHGTHVAGILAAGDSSTGMRGLAPGVSLYIGKIMDERGQGVESRMVRGVEWAMSEGVDVINISAGSPNELPALKRVIDRAFEEGIHLVAAAGNRGEETGRLTTVDYPARYREVISVGAVDRLDRKAGFSSYGPGLDVSAPGVSIRSTSVGRSYEHKSGTSMAAPFVAGAMAIMLETGEYEQPADLRRALRSDTWLEPLGLIQPNPLTGHGRLSFPNVTPGFLRPVEEVTVTLTDFSADGATVELRWLSAQEGVTSFIVRRNGEQIYAGSSTSLTDEITEDGDYRYSVTAVLDDAESSPVFSRDVTVRLFNESGPVIARYTDVQEQNWFVPYVTSMVNRGLMGGFADDTFRPNDQVTRGQLSVILDRYLGLSGTGASFSDVPDTHFAAPSIRRMQGAGLIAGFNDGTFRPNQPVTRADAAVLIDRALPLERDPVHPIVFEDVPDQAYFEQAVTTLASLGILTGYENGSFRPGGLMTRAEFSAVMDRAVRTVEEAEERVLR